MGALKRRWRLLVALPLVFGVAVATFALSRAREYKATAVLKVEVLKLQNFDDQGDVSSNRIRTAATLISSFVPAEEIVRKFNLDAAPYNTPADEFWDNIALVKIIKGTELLEISTFTLNPRLSRDIANYIANQMVNRNAEFSQSDSLKAKEAIRKHLDAVKRSLDIAGSALLKFEKKTNLREVRQDIQILLGERVHLSSMLFENFLNRKDIDQETLSREKENMRKLLGNGVKFSELKMVMDKNDNLLAYHRVLSKKRLEAKGRLSAIFGTLAGASGSGALSGARSMKDAGAGDVAESKSELEKIRGEKKALEDDRKKLSAALPSLAIEIQVSISRLKSLRTAMSGMKKASRAGSSFSDDPAPLDTPRKNTGANNGKASGTPFGAVSIKIVDEESRLEGLREKKKRYRERIIRIDSELPQKAESLRKHEARYLLLEISQMSNEMRKIESEILANRRKIAEWQARRKTLLAKLGALEDVSSDVGKLGGPLHLPPPSVDLEDEGTSENVLVKRLRLLDRDIVKVDHLRHRGKLFVSQLEEIDAKLDKKITEEATLLALHKKLQGAYVLAETSYFAVSKNYNQVELAVLSNSTNLKIVSRAKLPEKPVARLHLAILASLSLVFGLLFAMFAALFLEFRKTIFALEEPGGA